MYTFHLESPSTTEGYKSTQALTKASKNHPTLFYFCDCRKYQESKAPRGTCTCCTLYCNLAQPHLSTSIYVYMQYRPFKMFCRSTLCTRGVIMKFFVKWEATTWLREQNCQLLADFVGPQKRFICNDWNPSTSMYCDSWQLHFKLW